MGCVVNKTHLDAVCLNTQMSLGELQKYYDSTKTQIKEKLKPCFGEVLEKKAKDKTELTIKFVHLNETQSEHLKIVLPFYVNLKSLELWKTHLGVEGARKLASALGYLKQLETLSLEDNQLHTEGLRVLSVPLNQLTCLQSLALYVNDIDTDGGKVLATVCQRHRKLQALCVSENHLGPEGVEALVSGLLACAGTLHSLELGYNRLQRQGGQHLLQVLPRLPVLEKVVLAGNEIGEGMERQLFRKAPNVHFYF